MTELDLIVLVIVCVAAIGGFMRGLVQEVLSLAAWIVTLFAINRLHSPLTDWVMGYTDDEVTSSVLAFAILLLIPSAAITLIAKAAAGDPGQSSLKIVDKILGFGFGMVKGVIMAVLAFSVVALGYDATWGVSGRPTWITNARSYPFINASSVQLVEMLGQRRAELEAKDRKVPGGKE